MAWATAKDLEVVEVIGIATVLESDHMIDFEAASPTALAAAPAVTVENPPAYHRPTAAIESAVAAGHATKPTAPTGTLRA